MPPRDADLYKLNGRLVKSTRDTEAENSVVIEVKGMVKSTRDTEAEKSSGANLLFL